MRRRFLLYFSIALAGVSCLTAAQAEGCDAAALYESMVRAKGGREKLHAVEALYVYGWWRYWNWEKLRLITKKERTLYLFPDFLWNRREMELFGISVLTIDYKTNTAKTMDGGPRGVKVEPFQENTAIIVDQAELLLETRWWRPKVLGCFEETYEGVASHVVRVSGSGLEFEYFIEKGKDLPWMVRRRKGESDYLRGLFKYKNVDGLMMPTYFRVVDKYKGRPTSSYAFNLRFEINPAYDPRVREWDPTNEGDPEPWRKKRTR